MIENARSVTMPLTVSGSAPSSILVIGIDGANLQRDLDQIVFDEAGIDLVLFLAARLFVVVNVEVQAPNKTIAARAQL